MAKQNKMTAGQEAAATTASTVSALLRCGMAGCTWCAISGLAAGVRCQGGISNVRCSACCHGGAWYGVAFRADGGRGSGRSSNKTASSDAVFAFSARLIRSSNSDASIRPCAMCSCKKADRLVTVGIADSRFHGSLCRVGRLVLRRLLGGIRLGCGRLSHNHQYPRPASVEPDHSELRERAQTWHVWTKITEQLNH